MLARWIRNVGFSAFALTACGGTVKTQESGTPSEQLQSDGVSRCQAACVKVLACGLDKQSCDCSACACPDAAQCDCAPCTCPATEETPAKCESDCNEAVQKSLASGCAPAMLKLLDCLSGASCESGQVPCKAESDAMKACNKASPSSDSRPPSATTSAPGPGGRVVCRGASGSGSAAAVGSPPPPPGTTSCSSGWESCSDGRSYGVECDFTSSADLSCTCLVDGAAQGAFTAADCPSNVADVNRLCGWDLE